MNERENDSVEVRRITDVGAMKDAEALFDKPIQDEAAERFVSSAGHHLLIAYEGGNPVGMITGVEMIHPDKGTEMFLYELGVDETHRGRGIGTQLVQQLAEIARQRGCYGMWVLTDQENEPARGAYERAGGHREADQVMYAWSGFDPLEEPWLPEGRSERRWGRGRQPTAEMRPEEAVKLLDHLEQAGIEAWVDGGWGVDALLHEQRRSHDDLDLVVELGDVEKLQEVLKSHGYTNQHGEAPLSFEMVAPDGRQVDVHPVTFDEHGDGIYQMDNGKTWTYPAEGLAGIGHIAGRKVRCLTPELQMRVHAGYELSEKDHEEIRALQERFGVEPPPGYQAPQTR